MNYKSDTDLNQVILLSFHKLKILTCQAKSQISVSLVHRQLQNRDLVKPKSVLLKHESIQTELTDIYLPLASSCTKLEYSLCKVP